MQRDPAVSVLVCVADVPTANNNDWAPFAVGTLQAIGQFKPDGRARYLVVSNTVKAVSDKSREEVEKAQIPYLACGLDIALRALRYAADWSRMSRSAGGERAARALPGAASTAGADLPQSERETVDYLKRFGVPVVPQVLATDAKQAVAAARDMNGPVVLKIASPDIAHKTEVGGVVLNLQGDDAVEAAFRRIMDAAASAMPKARLDGVIVSPMRKGGIELFTGVRVDAQWGPVIALGLGGVWIEALQDVSLRLLPVTPADVEQMVSELRGAKLLQGFRGAPPVDVAKLADAVARIGDAALALGATLDTLEVNPLLADGARIEALDALATYNH